MPSITLAPSTASARSVFYVQAPDFAANQVLSVQLHRLCDHLNRTGHECYLSGGRMTSGSLWTPVLTPQLKAAHYLAGRIPVTITATHVPTTTRLGVWVEYAPLGHETDPLRGGLAELRAVDAPNTLLGSLPLNVPWADVAYFYPQPDVPRQGPPLLYAEALHANDKAVRSEHANAVDLSPSVAGPLSAQERAQRLRQAPCLYAYEAGTITTEARLCGCPVVYVSNDYALITPPTGYWNTAATVWNATTPPDCDTLAAELADFQRHYHALVQRFDSDVADLVEQTTHIAQKLDCQVAWPAKTLETIEAWAIPKKELAAWADQTQYRHLQEQYQTWRRRTSLREIDGEIYAEHVASGQLQPLGVVLYASVHNLDGVANTIDSLEQGLWKPAHLTVVAPVECPVSAEELDPRLSWIHHTPQYRASEPSELNAQLQHTLHGLPWLLLLEAGTTLEPHALIEFALATHRPDAQLVYCDDDSPGLDGLPVPHFKPDFNTEWLRSVNYLGTALAVRTEHWLQNGTAQRIENTYGLTLHLAATHGSHAIAHIDTVLAHHSGAVADNTETDELAQLQTFLQRQGLQAQVQAGTTWGSRLLEYQPQTARSVSVVIPTGQQLGYLQSFLQSLHQFADPQLLEIILVAELRHHTALADAVADIPLPLRIVNTTNDGPYNHAAALNAGAHAATGELLLFADDDIECLHAHWLQTLRGYMEQPDIACVAPRLTLQVGKEARLVGGPLIAGMGNGTAPYLGGKQLLAEQGLFSRLQTSQDVSAVAGHCFLTRRSVWQTLGGFDASTFHLTHTVLDYCLRARQQGYRHVWTPVSNVLHHGGKTLTLVMRQPEQVLQLQQSALREQEALVQRWGRTLACDGHYNRHLSLAKPYDIETDIVIDWPRDRHERPTVLGLPISSGAGQYRVIEPLNALQQAGLARTCVVYPRADRTMRTPTAFELARTNPDRLVVQHSIGDQHFKLLREYRRICPDLFIVQMVDDLFRDLHKDHHNHQFHQREGDVRMREALALSDRLVVTTQPLADAYGPYCNDVKIVPNCLNDAVWGQFYKGPPAPRQRLRVGWAGAGQHWGDLKMMVEVVATLSEQVDWVFMGMCPDVLRPYVKEFHPFVSFADYPAKLATLDLDLAIAPLEVNAFNEAKSNLRLLEYGAMGWPVVCSDVYPFRTQNPPVLHVPNTPQAWLQALQPLLTDPALRHRQGQALHQWVSEHFYLSRNANVWHQALFTPNPAQR